MISTLIVFSVKTTFFFLNALGCVPLSHSLRSNHFSPLVVKGRCGFSHTVDDPRLAFSQACCNNVSLFSCILYSFVSS